MPKNALLVALGSHGDVHPFVGLGLALRRRGHAVTVAANAHFQPLIEQAGLMFLPVGTAEEYARLMGNADLWHAQKSFKIVFEEGVLRFVRPVYHLIEQYAKAHDSTIVVASSLGFGARIAEEKLKIPTAMVHLSPSLFRSVHDVSKIGGSPIGPQTPRAFRRLIFWIGDYFVVDKLLAPQINAFRRELGLPRVKGILRDWVHSPRLTIGLFPPWFAPPQVDWPPQVRLTGFPLYDERGLEPLAPELVQFLDEDLASPPVAFTPGSAMQHGGKFFDAAAQACRLLGRRGLLLTRHREHLPGTLPPGVRHVPYAPFSELLPRCAALVHHGGIGTSSQALAAGIPQVVMPMAYDQPDNAYRMVKLGVAAELVPEQFTAPNLAKTLGALLGSTEVAASCRNIAAKFVGVAALGQTCDLIEGLSPRA